MGTMEDMFEETPERICYGAVSTVEAEEGKEVRRSSKIGRDHHCAKLTHRDLYVENIETNVANGKFK